MTDGGNGGCLALGQGRAALKFASDGMDGDASLAGERGEAKRNRNDRFQGSGS